MKEFLIVGLGGFAGSVLRFRVSAAFLHNFPASRFPWATFTVNIAGCLLIGITVAFLERIEFYNSELRLLLITGFLGGFTTFSAFGLETVFLLRSGNTHLAIANVLLSIAFCLLAAWLGLRLGATLAAY